ncbi:hypothetical protein B0H10DRAFT_1804201 [Mycena sp. CBHHK59/15]|nr:hypothetical protein B0H10DRAFT_1804201 [Mycena sp. CBHHK59/15]
MDPVTDLQSLQKADDLWFPSDLVILRAGNRIFRVFAAILKEKSSVFADMFSFPQPASGSEVETMDGTPVVRLHDDPRELEAVLKAIFDSNFFMPHPATALVGDIVGVLRLSHKYDIPFLRRRALEHMEYLFPTSLTAYKERRRASLETPNDPNPEFAPSVAPILAWVKVAVEVDAIWLLPAAYYDACAYGIEKILAAGPTWDALGETEKTAFIVGHSTQIQDFAEMRNFLALAVDDESDCEDWNSCNMSRLDAIRNYEGQSSFCDPLNPWKAEDFDWLVSGTGLCSSCFDASRAPYEAAQKRFWNRLPEMFGLSGWSELEKLRDAALSAS